ncbi:YbiU family protein [Streptomyces sp. NPDC057616]|uniref:YbiU family protein n=1 Tax=Streptomyces sp. NPDC057616 TaxID=3346183 RepID=UPI0036AC1733
MRDRSSSTARTRAPDSSGEVSAAAVTGTGRGVRARRHPALHRALTPIPDVRAGDSAWWHCDMIHSVAPVENQQGWGNVMYIPAAPWCPPNETYAASVREAFTTGSSPGDFPEEHYERSWTGRFTLDQLNDTGRRGLGIA